MEAWNKKHDPAAYLHNVKKMRDLRNAASAAKAAKDTETSPETG
jgi:hypothetical protein